MTKHHPSTPGEPRPITPKSGSVEHPSHVGDAASDERLDYGHFQAITMPPNLLKELWTSKPPSIPADRRYPLPSSQPAGGTSERSAATADSEGQLADTPPETPNAISAAPPPPDADPQEQPVPPHAKHPGLTTTTLILSRSMDAKLARIVIGAMILAVVMAAILLLRQPISRTAGQPNRSAAPAASRVAPIPSPPLDSVQTTGAAPRAPVALEASAAASTRGAPPNSESSAPPATTARAPRSTTAHPTAAASTHAPQPSPRARSSELFFPPRE